MHLTRLAEQHPEKPAIIGPGGDITTYRELDRRSVRFARLLALRGLRPGDHAALIADNSPDFLATAFACQRAGLLWTPVNHHFTAQEAGYVLNDCGARALIAAGTCAQLVAAAADLAPRLELRLSLGTPGVPGFEDLDVVSADLPATPPADEREGARMSYSSGTTGRPKGILPVRPDAPFGTGSTLERNFLPKLLGVGEDTVYLCPAPLYHTAPIAWSMGTIRLGGTVVLMDRFDAAAALELIERHRVTHTQFVPTMLVRILKLPEAVRLSRDLSSLRALVHAAAPCPVEVKQRFIDWLGPIVYEFYSGSEGNCFFFIDSAEWLAHRGSVGRAAVGRALVLDEDGHEVPAGEVGVVWFEGSGDFTYHNDPERTAQAHDAQGRSTMGDLGRLDEDGYLYLVDRRVDLIVSGGVNIYPREIEDVLVQHPAVLDAAVVGAPDPEFGRRVRAVVDPADPSTAGPALAEELLSYCRERLAHFKCPRTIEFTERLPRTPTGKLLRRELLAES
ncbi:AMP-binding protein [Streptomyces sp. UG1]|uniref:AMP-binding protein n=1 Tax=Streptomyces sp. UG1 TaxID=3417652 RepID=UPI003CE6C0A9